MQKIDKNKLLFIGMFFEGLIFLFFNFNVCLSSPDSSLLFSFGILIIQTLILGFIALGFWKIDSSKIKSLISGTESESAGTKRLISFSLFIFAVLFWTIFLIFTKQVYLVYVQSTALNRLILNFIIFLIVLDFQLFFGLPFYLPENSNFNLTRITTFFASVKKPGRITIFTFVGVMVFALIIVFTGSGVDPLGLNIIDLGVPLLENQVIYGVGLILLMMWMDYGYGFKIFSTPLNISDGRKKRELVVFVLLWGIAFLAWSLQEIPVFNNFVIGNTPPNYEFFPYSDARDYDENAILMMLGGSQGAVFRRPLYITVLSLIHLLGGFDYNRVVLLQTLLLSLIPSILYLIGKELHSDGVGILMGLFVIFRELNSILIANITSVSNSKLLLTDVPALLIVSIIALVLIRWVKWRPKAPINSIVLGGWLGAGILLRSQVSFLVPLVLITCVVIFWGDTKEILKKSGWIVVGIFIVISPVLIRNYQINGAIGFDEPGYVILNLRRFDPTGEFFNPSQSLPGSEVYKELILYIISHPGQVMAFIIDHFMRNVLSTFFIFPVRLEQITSWKDFFYITDPFWKEVNLSNGMINSLLITLNLILLAIGISVSLKKNLWMTLSLLGVFTFYNLSNSIARLSGWRFVLPVDWIGYTFFVIGLTEILLILSRIIFNKPGADSLANVKEQSHPKTIYLQLVFVVFLGWMGVMREQFGPENIYLTDRIELCSTLLKTLEMNPDKVISEEEFLEYCMNETTIVKYGTGVYPLYFKKNSGYSDASEKRDLEATKNFSRFIFSLIGEGQVNAFVRTEGPIPYFPNGSNVIAIGKKVRSGLEADVVFFGDNYEKMIAADSLNFAIGSDENK